MRRGEVYLVSLDPTVGSETKKTRPAVIVSNDMQNKHTNRVVVIPITSQVKKIYQFEAAVSIQNKSGKAMADQIRTVDKSRLVKKLDDLSNEELLHLEKAMKVVLNIS